VICPKCRQPNPEGQSWCHACLAPLAGPGFVAPSDALRHVRRGAILGSLVASFALTGSLLAAPGSPLSALVRTEPPPAPVAAAATSDTGLAKFEPAEGCYLGAYVLADINISGKMERWEELTGKGHASYLKYVGHGRPFPTEWAKAVKEREAAPNIAFEPNDGLAKVVDNEYLRGFARDAAALGGPVFLRFASEMNGPWTKYHGSPRAYREKFRLVSRVMREEAPNVAMVWTPYCTPLGPIPDYYPGDDAVDWVGVNVYSVHHHDGSRHHPAHREDPAELLRPIYELYADRKPIQISEYASTHFCKACGEYTADFAMDKMIRMYRSLPRDFPRVKMIYWFSWDTVSGKAAENNYAVTDDPVIRDTYRRLVAPDYFHARMAPAASSHGD
jgi:hypothetical protein